MSKTKSRTIPDLRPHHNEFTIEHCSTLLEKLGRCLEIIYGPDMGMTYIADQCDPERMQQDLFSVMGEQQLINLFESDIGKGVIIGIFYNQFVGNIHLEDEESWIY